MSLKDIVGNRWTLLYDQAAKEYAEACRAKNIPNKRGWKRRMKWLDGKLREDTWEAQNHELPFK